MPFGKKTQNKFNARDYILQPLLTKRGHCHMGMDVYTIRYRRHDGTEVQRPIIADDARGAARAAKSNGKKMGWQPLYDSLEVEGTPLSATARNPGHTTLNKPLRKFTCTFRALDQHLYQQTFEAFDLGNAKTAARAVAKAEGGTALLEHLKPIKAAKGDVIAPADRVLRTGMPHSGVQIRSLPQGRRRLRLDEDTEDDPYAHGMPIML